MSVYATQCPFTKRGSEMVPRYPIDRSGQPRKDAADFWLTWRGQGTVVDALALRQRYGNLIWTASPTAAPWSPGIYDSMRELLQAYDGERDYLLLIGNPILMSMMSVLAGEYTDQLQFLQWSNGDYIPIKVQL